MDNLPGSCSHIDSKYILFQILSLNKAVIQRSRLRNEYLKDKNNAARIAYKKQRNVCVSILRKSKKSYHDTKNLDTKNITGNKKF